MGSTGGAPLGNNNRVKGDEWTQAIKRALARRGGGDYRKGLDILASRLVKTAEEDDVAYMKAIESVGDRIEGKVSQSVEHTGEGGGPVITQVTLTALK